MARQIDAELRDALENDYGLCFEVPARNEDCRGWVSISPQIVDDAIASYYVTRFDYRNRWVEMEYDPCGDELPYSAEFTFQTEAELNHFLDRTVPPDGRLARITDVDDFPG